MHSGASASASAGCLEPHSRAFGRKHTPRAVLGGVHVGEIHSNAASLRLGEDCERIEVRFDDPGALDIRRRDGGEHLPERHSLDLPGRGDRTTQLAGQVECRSRIARGSQCRM